MSRENRWAESVSVFAIGLGIGAALGVLFAPQSGSDTRNSLIEGAKDGVNGAIATGQRWNRQVQEGIDEAKDQVRHATEVGERAYREARNSSS